MPPKLRPLIVSVPTEVNAVLIRAQAVTKGAAKRMHIAALSYATLRMAIDPGFSPQRIN